MNPEHLPLTSPEMINRRKQIHTIVAAYIGKDPTLLKTLPSVLQEESKPVSIEDHRHLTEILLHNHHHLNLPPETFDTLANMADEFMATLDAQTQFNLRDQAVK